MSKSLSAAALAENPSSAAKTIAEDPLLVYESQSVGREFLAFVPTGDERRDIEARRSESIIRSWRGKPVARCEQASYTLRSEMKHARNFETERVMNSEKMFFVVLSVMVLLLGSIFVYFVMNFPF
ncbi:MAG: hypothetical protein K2X27_11555 [Candidatus Obscuribacterales bacterium]|nr:hypothetical protein [Candidatus Obscuribacterales bacterium]